MLATRLLDKAGHLTETADNGEEAVHRSGQSNFDVILMDLQMPVMNGIEATKAIRQRERDTGTPRVPIIAMTANAMNNDRSACAEAGMDDFIAKPINAQLLLEKLASLTR